MFPKHRLNNIFPQQNILYSDNTEYGCNCNEKNKCLLDNKCLTPRIVYRTDVTNDQTKEQKFYYGISDTPFKEQYENHKKSFRHESTSIMKLLVMCNMKLLVSIMSY